MSTYKTNNAMKRILIYTGVVLTCILAGWLVGRYHKGKSVVVTERVDTVFVHDTFTIEKPILKESKIIETMLVAVRDTIVKNDTTYISLPRESKTYGDDRFTAVVSGYKPSLDRLDIYIERQTVTKYLIPEPKKPKMNYLALGAEVAYVGGLSIPIYLEYERLLHKNLGIYGKIMYDLSNENLGAGFGVRAKFGW